MDKVSIVIIDFGSQFTRLIPKRLNQLKIRSAVISPLSGHDQIKKLQPQALILSGGPLSVSLDNCKYYQTIKDYLDYNLPTLAICYSMQAICKNFGGVISCGTSREFGGTAVTLDDSPLFRDIPSTITVWMSHCDTVEKEPSSFKVLAKSINNHIVSMSNEEKKIYCVQFHPETTHTEYGIEILKNFAVNIAKCPTNWDNQDIIKDIVKKIKNDIGNKRAVIGISGGVDSMVTAKLAYEAIGDQLSCIFIDTGLMRANEANQVKEIFERKIKIPLTIHNAQDLFLTRLKGIKDPDKKRKIIGKTFIDAFEQAITKDIEYLIQGTLLSDVIESISEMGHVIKLHHNVGALPKNMRLKVVEPLREFLKDEVRNIGLKLHLPDELLHKHPFPGPGLAIRIIGDVTKERLDIIRAADNIFTEELGKNGLYNTIWQAFAVLITVKTVGVMGDGKTYENICAIRAVDSIDGMTATASSLNLEFLKEVSTKIINKVPGISRVVYDVTSKPPASIEWE